MNGQQFLVISDTHGNIDMVAEVLSWAKQRELHTVVFLGDGIADLYCAEKTAGFSCIWNIVRGNNDLDVSFPESSVIEAGGRRFFLCHGHRYALYRNYDALIAAARNVQADVALFGHTHIPVQGHAGGLLLVNPGSVGSPRSNAGATFAVIASVPKKPLNVQFWEIGSKGDIRECKI